MTYKTLPAFGGWAGPKTPKLLIVGEAWGENEDQAHQPFVGTSGIELWRMLGEALPDTDPQGHASALRAAYRLGNAWIRNRASWLETAGIAFSNVFNLRPPGNRIEDLCDRKPNGMSPLAKGLYLRPDYLPEVDRLLEEIKQAGPNCILAAGNTACWALLHATNISSIRGAVALSPVTGGKVLPSYHPAAILRQWVWRPITVADIIKAVKEAETPELIRPKRQVMINPLMHDIVTWRDWIIGEAPPLLAVDIETQWQQIKCIGFAWNRSAAITIPFLDPARTPPHYWPTHAEEVSAWQVVRDVLESGIPKLFHNGMYDLQYIIRWGMRPQALQHDTMLLHHSLYPELRKSLGFLGSIYSNEAAWKLMGRPKADTVKRDE